MGDRVEAEMCCVLFCIIKIAIVLTLNATCLTNCILCIVRKYQLYWQTAIERARGRESSTSFRAFILITSSCFFVVKRSKKRNIQISNRMNTIILESICIESCVEIVDRHEMNVQYWTFYRDKSEENKHFFM